MAEHNAGSDAGRHTSRRVATWFTWWILLMSLWVAVDDSLATDELLAGAGAAALAALAAEVVSYQTSTRYRIRAAWLWQALRLPGQVTSDTLAVFGVLARAVAGKAIAGKAPPSGAYRELPVRYGDDTPLGVTRRVLLTGARSLTPNAFVVDIDKERDVMLVHELVVRQ